MRTSPAVKPAAAGGEGWRQPGQLSVTYRHDGPVRQESADGTGTIKAIPEDYKLLRLGMAAHARPAARPKKQSRQQIGQGGDDGLGDLARYWIMWINGQHRQLAPLLRLQSRNQHFLALPEWRWTAVPAAHHG
jgi:hypothetical protein